MGDPAEPRRPLVEPSAEVQQLLEMHEGDPTSAVVPLITAEHITETQTEWARENARSHSRFILDRAIQLALLIIALAFIGFLIVRLDDRNPELLKSLLDKIITFVTGVAAGAGGHALYQRSRKETRE